MGCGTARLLGQGRHVRLFLCWGDPVAGRRTAPPHLTTIVPANTAADYYEGWTYENGAFRLNFIEPWAMESIVFSAAKNPGDPPIVPQATPGSVNSASGR